MSQLRAFDSTEKKSHREKKREKITVCAACRPWYSARRSNR
jgi:hypothetical protein